MLVGDIIFAMILGFLSALVFGWIFRSRGLPGIIPLFTLFFLFAWLGGLWLRPVGPPVFGVYWAQGLIMVVLIFLLLAATMRGPSEPPQAEEDRAAKGNAKAVGAAFWILIVVLLAAVLIGYQM